jgi:hypothetical protein
MSFGWWTIIDAHGKLLSTKKTAVLPGPVLDVLPPSARQKSEKQNIIAAKLIGLCYELNTMFHTVTRLYNQFNVNNIA